jgi:hypothetical protein
LSATEAAKKRVSEVIIMQVKGLAASVFEKFATPADCAQLVELVEDRDEFIAQLDDITEFATLLKEALAPPLQLSPPISERPPEMPDDIEAVSTMEPKTTKH